MRSLPLCSAIVKAFRESDAASHVTRSWHESAMDRVTDQPVGAGRDERRSGDRSWERLKLDRRSQMPRPATPPRARIATIGITETAGPRGDGPMPDHVPQARGGDDCEQHDLGGSPKPSPRTEGWQSGAHRQMLRTLQTTASEHSSTGTIFGPARSR